MTQNRQGEMCAAIGIRLREQITAPDAIAPHRPGHPVFHLPSGFIDEVLMPSA